LRTKGGLRETLALFDSVIGIERIRAVHLNDSKGNLGSGLDRHEHIGLGFIGEDGFRTILGHDLFWKHPLILETPVDARGDDAGNIRKVRVLAGS
jgi:deoxyribonuclease-4